MNPALKIIGCGAAMAASGFVLTRAIGKDVSEENAKLTLATGLRATLAGAGAGLAAVKMLDLALGKAVPGRAIGVAMAMSGASLLMDMTILRDKPAVLVTGEFFGE